MKHGEAKNYVCPQSIGQEQEQRCRASGCAAWRWGEPKWGDIDQRRGYCGLAGETKYPVNPEHE